MGTTGDLGHGIGFHGESTRIGWRNLSGERRETIEEGGQIRIRDHNSSRIQRARDSNVDLDQNGTCRIVESSTIQGEG